MRPRFGIALPAFASPGAGLFRTPGLAALDPALCLDVAREADAAGFDSIFAPDHLMIGRDDAVLEGWSLLAAVAAVTSRARLGLIQQSNLFRSPAVGAHAAAPRDAQSGGPVLLVAHPRPHEAETTADGLDYPGDEAVRVERLAEALALTRALWTGQRIDHDGRHGRLRGAASRPVPAGRPPIWLAGTRPDSLALLARTGDGWCTPPVSLADLAARLALVDAALADAGRSRADVEIALETQVLVAPSIGALRDRLAAMIALDPDGSLSGRPPLEPEAMGRFLDGGTDELPPAVAERWIVGTPEMVRRRIGAYMDLGVGHFVLWFMDLPDRRGLTDFIRTVMPTF